MNDSLQRQQAALLWRRASSLKQSVLRVCVAKWARLAASLF
jgi:hypothetical protein